MTYVAFVEIGMTTGSCYCKTSKTPCKSKIIDFEAKNDFFFTHIFHVICFAHLLFCA